MERQGTIAYRKQDGSFRQQVHLQKEEEKMPSMEVQSFARFLLKYQGQFSKENAETRAQ